MRYNVCTFQINKIALTYNDIILLKKEFIVAT